MDKKLTPTKKVTRSKFITALCSMVPIPFVSKARATELDQDVDGDDDYETLLKPDGSTVKVKRNNLKNTTVKKSLSNRELKSWLDT